MVAYTEGIYTTVDIGFLLSDSILSGLILQIVFILRCIFPRPPHWLSMHKALQ